MLNMTPDDDVVRRNIKRTLACKLTEREFMDIAKTMVAKKAEYAQLEAAWQKEREDGLAKAR